MYKSLLYWKWVKSVRFWICIPPRRQLGRGARGYLNVQPTRGPPCFNPSRNRRLVASRVTVNSMTHSLFYFAQSISQSWTVILRRCSIYIKLFAPPFPRRRSKSAPMHQTCRDDRGGPYHFLLYNFCSHSTYSFAARDAENFWETHPINPNLYDYIIVLTNPLKFYQRTQHEATHKI